MEYFDETYMELLANKSIGIEIRRKPTMIILKHLFIGLFLPI
jgi:hypothetical protein